MIEQLKYAGMYIAASRDQEIIVKVEGVFPMLSIKNAMDLTRFEKEGKIYIASEAIKNVQENPQRWMFTPLGGTTALRFGEATRYLGNLPDYSKYVADIQQTNLKLGESYAINQIMRLLQIDFDTAKIINQNCIKLRNNVV